MKQCDPLDISSIALNLFIYFSYYIASYLQTLPVPNTHLLISVKTSEHINNKSFHFKTQQNKIQV